eukprot:6197110-Pleurochrysis_carterae.AAC.1
MKFSRRTVRVAFGVENSARSVRQRSRCARYLSCCIEGSARSWVLCWAESERTSRSIACAWSVAGRRQMVSLRTLNRRKWRSEVAFSVAVLALKLVFRIVLLVDAAPASCRFCLRSRRQG